jgi:drug/metabolite transporter (DMT)-like permease
MIGALFALGGALSWGASQVITKAGAAHIAATQFGWIRSLVGLACIALLAVFRGGFSVPETPLILWAMAAGALDCFLGSMLFVLALQRIQAHEAAPLANSAPLWGVLGAWTILREPFAPGALVAALLVIVGGYSLASRKNRGASGASLAGFAIALGAGISWGIAETVPAKYCMTHGMDPVLFQLVMLGTATVLWGIAYGVRRAMGGNPTATRRGTAAAVISGFLGFFLGWILWLRGVELSPASLVAPLRGATIVVAVVGGVVFLRERPTARAIAGMACIVVAVVLVLLSMG